MSIYPRGYIMPILMDKRWHFIVVLIYISLTISDVEHLFMCLLVIWLPSLEKCLFKSFACFWIGLFVCHWVLGILRIFWILISYQVYDFQTFFPILWDDFLFCWNCCAAQNLKKLQWSPTCLLISSVACAFGVTSRKSLSHYE